MRSVPKYTIFSINSLSEYSFIAIIMVFTHSVKKVRLTIIDNGHDAVKIQFCNRQDLEQRKTSLIVSLHEKTL